LPYPEYLYDTRLSHIVPGSTIASERFKNIHNFFHTLKIAEAVIENDSLDLLYYLKIILLYFDSKISTIV